MYTNAEKLAGYQVSQPQLEEHCTPREYINLALLDNKQLSFIHHSAEVYPAISNGVQLF